MPLTFPAHQAVVLPLKRRFPGWFDGLALVVGAGAPDVAFGLWLDWLFVHGPSSLPLLVPFTVAYCVGLRRLAMPGLFRYLPTVAGADLRAYGAMAAGRPSLVKTTVSAAIGLISHQAWDSLSHAGHPVAETLGFDAELFTLGLGPISRDMTVARIIQLSGHTLGSAVALFILWWLVATRANVLDWSEADKLTAEPQPDRRLMMLIGFVVTVTGLSAWPFVGGRGPFVVIVLYAAAMVVIGWLIERRREPTV